MSALEYAARTTLLCRDYVPEHLSDLEIFDYFHSTRVLCVSDLANVSSHAGQTALVTLVSLLSRMGVQVSLAIPETALVYPEPLLLGVSIGEALTKRSGKFIPTATIVRNDGPTPDLIFGLGDTPIRSGPVPVWRLSAGEWDGCLELGESAETRRFRGEWPIGPMASAALGAGEAFKFVMRRMPWNNPAASVFFEISERSFCQFDPVLVPLHGMDFGELDFVSAGAICQATLYAMMALPRARACGRIFDKDITEQSNLNRNMLTLVDDVGVAKAVLAAHRCRPKLLLESVSEHFPPKSAESRRLAPRVVVGVDDIPSRWEVQRYANGWLAVGGTSHLGVSSSSHSSGEACCACLHPTDDPTAALGQPIPTVSFVSFWAGLTTTVRLIRECLGANCPPNRQQLWLSPLRMDLPFAAWWMPVPAHKDCPVRCHRSQEMVVS